ncbi:hypothetical protein GXW82_35725 [Streptacidiphilus sp. 4-A2]|nr:hypothetical protein [Streptacidiphilus sp. 4-A2]
MNTTSRSRKFLALSVAVVAAAGIGLGTSTNSFAATKTKPTPTTSTAAAHITKFTPTVSDPTTATAAELAAAGKAGGKTAQLAVKPMDSNAGNPISRATIMARAESWVAAAPLQRNRLPHRLQRHLSHRLLGLHLDGLGSALQLRQQLR